MTRFSGGWGPGSRCCDLMKKKKKKKVDWPLGAWGWGWVQAPALSVIGDVLTTSSSPPPSFGTELSIQKLRVLFLRNLIIFKSVFVHIFSSSEMKTRLPYLT